MVPLTNYTFTSNQNKAHFHNLDNRLDPPELISNRVYGSYFLLT